MALTDKQVRSFKPEVKRVRHSDGHGLVIEVMPSGKKVFRFNYRFGGKQRTIGLGDYPETSLAEARIAVADLKKLLRDGQDPKTVAEKQTVEEVDATSAQPTWKEVAHDYLMLRQRSGAAPRTMQKLIRQVEVTIDAYGDRSVTAISAEDVLAVVNPIAEGGHVENAHEIRSRFSQIFRYAGARGLIEHDPAAMTIGAMVKRQRGEFAGVTKPTEVGKLMRALQFYQSKNVIIGSALLLSAYVFARNSELRGMCWDEIDFDAAVWSIPGDRMKMRRDHLVPLAKQAVSLLKSVRRFDFGSQLVFPSPRDPRRQMSEVTLNHALRRLGYGRDQHVHHGFRTTASTNLNEMGWNSDWIEAQLAHVSTNKVRASYNKAQYLDGRRKMMQVYADWLDAQATED
ncbi:MAG: integrase arm-type DNA-binding domain-containing protein [Pseudomonadota bacterium]